MQKHVNLVDLVKSFPTNIYLQNLASMQKRTRPIKFAHLAEKSENGSTSNLSTKVRGGEHRNGAPADHKEVCVTINVRHSTGVWETRRYMCNDRPEDVTPFSTCDSQDSWDWVKSSLQCGKF